ncbi:hypothetical protein UCDDA912_g07957 [Diaporthe ampelina]|uniref:Uncharacterized protein n=1 Tax=Diaporthe ampelina TaxID=1214573 RepID=A0A0G2FD69_9PEZI|nr:hypothetical protein UCDDA912_g07957 [Diaporthe ampelina]
MWLAWINYIDENIGLTKANVTEHVATLLSTQPNQSVVEAASHNGQSILVGSTALRSDGIAVDLNNLAYLATAIENCTLSALANLTGVENITSMDPLEYVQSFQHNASWCVFEEGASQYVDKTMDNDDYDVNIFQHFMLFWGPATVLFGPLWVLVIPPE